MNNLINFKMLIVNLKRKHGLCKYGEQVLVRRLIVSFLLRTHSSRYNYFNDFEWTM